MSGSNSSLINNDRPLKYIDSCVIWWVKSLWWGEGEGEGDRTKLDKWPLISANFQRKF